MRIGLRTSQEASRVQGGPARGRRWRYGAAAGGIGEEKFGDEAALAREESVEMGAGKVRREEGVEQRRMRAPSQDDSDAPPPYGRAPLYEEDSPRGRTAWGRAQACPKPSLRAASPS